MQRRTLLALAPTLALAIALAGLTAQVSAQSAFPARPIRLVVPFPPGGPTDIFARHYASALAATIGQPVLVENKAGASGAIGAVQVARADPDGYTLVFGTASTHGLYNLMVRQPQYDAIKDFATVAIVGGAAAVILATPALPATLKSVIDMARATPGKLRYGSPGQGTFLHLAVERLKQEAGGVDIQHIPYKGSGQSRPALLGGQVELVVDTLGATLPLHRTGKVRVIAIASAQRSALAPDIPTVDEALGTRGFEAVLWNVVAAPAGTPVPVLEKLAAATNKALADPALQAELAKLAIQPTLDSNPAAAAAYLRAEQKRWQPVVDATGIKLD